MDTRYKLEEELRDAIRNRDEMRKQNIRMVISAVKMVEVEKGLKLDESGILSIIQKEIKIRFEVMEDAKKAGRSDLVEHALQEINFLETFLPKQYSEEELLEIISKTISDTGANSPVEIGKVMRAVLPKVQGRATGDQVSKLVRRLLQP